MTLSIGFTGTRYGMTDAQADVVRLIVAQLVKQTTPFERQCATKFEAHHGDCIGADAQFHAIVRPFPNSWIVGHPGPADDVARQAGCVFDLRMPSLPHMKRNRKIVDASNVMIAAPLEDFEQTNGGTWKTIGMARRFRRLLAIVGRSGNVRRNDEWIVKGLPR